jgi:hypothetical protein
MQAPLTPPNERRHGKRAKFLVGRRGANPQASTRTIVADGESGRSLWSAAASPAAPLPASHAKASCALLRVAFGGALWWPRRGSRAQTAWRRAAPGWAARTCESGCRCRARRVGRHPGFASQPMLARPPLQAGTRSCPGSATAPHPVYEHSRRRRIFHAENRTSRDQLGVSWRPHTLHNALSESANPLDSLVGRGGLEPPTLGLKERAGEFA